jgi:hypothetical protein
MRLNSTAFADGSAIPRRFTCDGADLSPPLNWSDAPTGTRSFTLEFISDDGSAVLNAPVYGHTGSGAVSYRCWLQLSGRGTQRSAGDLKQHKLTIAERRWMAKNLVASLTVGRHACVLRR